MGETQPSLWDQLDEKWLFFKEARDIVWTYEFEYSEEWELFINGKFTNKTSLPDDIPKNPQEVYKYSGWIDWKNWLVHPKRRKDYTSFFMARAFVRCLRLKSKKEWFDYVNSKNPLHEKYKFSLPENPQYEYKVNDWKSWSDWLGKNVDYKNYNETRRFVKSLKLKTKADWRRYCKNKKPQSIYTYPEIVYKEWQGWNIWLGNDLFGHPLKKKYSDIPDGAKACRCLGLDVNCTECDGKGYSFLTNQTV